MEWLERFNDAINYIENNLANELSYDEAAKIACCSTYHFQRMFSYIAGIPVSEYVRKRRLTMAAFDLQNGDKVLDTALRYGYDSPTSFNRAFKGVHGIPPSTARKDGASLKAFPRMSFKITVKGEAEMEYRIIKKDAFRIAGIKAKLEKDVDASFAAVPVLWQRAAEEGVLPRLLGMMNKEPMGVLGVSACMDSSEQWEYYIAVSTDCGDLENDMAEYLVPACTWAVFAGQGRMPMAVQDLEKRIVTEWLPGSGYEYADAPDIEVYLDDDQINGKFEVWLPIVKK